MKTTSDVSTPYTDGVCPVPSGQGDNTASSGGFDIGPGTVKESAHEAGPIVTTFQPKAGTSIPAKMDNSDELIPRHYHNIPGIDSKGIGV